MPYIQYFKYMRAKLYIAEIFECINLTIIGNLISNRIYIYDVKNTQRLFKMFNILLTLYFKLEICYEKKVFSQ